jgi:tartrate dehydratase alpha subunit/fumarate hydratase class I-like protein
MREVSVTRLSDAIRDAVIRANTVMTPDIKRQLEHGQELESEPVAAPASTALSPPCQCLGVLVP